MEEKSGKERKGRVMDQRWQGMDGGQAGDPNLGALHNGPPGAALRDVRDILGHPGGGFKGTGRGRGGGKGREGGRNGRREGPPPGRV